MKLKQLTESQKKSLPRKPRSAYMMFCNQRRPQLSAMEQYSTVPAKDKMATFSRIMSREWRELPERVKKDYAAQAQLDRHLFEQECAAQGLPIGKKKPKRAKTPFIIFSQSRRGALNEQHKAIPPKERFTAISKMLGDEWRLMTSEQKRPYELMAAEESRLLQLANRQAAQAEAGPSYPFAPYHQQDPQHHQHQFQHPQHFHHHQQQLNAHQYTQHLYPFFHQQQLQYPHNPHLHHPPT